MKLRALVGSLLLLTACAHTPPPATAEAPRSGSIFFFRASKAGKPGTVYVLGSAHLRHAKSAGLDRAITDAATQCERGAFELDLDAIDMDEMHAFVANEGSLGKKTLKDVVTPETYAAWVKAADAKHLPREQLEHMRPWLAAMILGLSSFGSGGVAGDAVEASGSEGVDKMLYAFEKQEPTKKRTIIGLETPLEQLAIFQKTSDALQDRMLRSAAVGASTGAGDKVLALYEAGDEADLAALFESEHDADPESDAFRKSLFDRRNASMSEKISGMFDAPGCTVVTVGAGHVIGRAGIVRRLEEKGFTVERVAAMGPTDSARLAFTIAAPKEYVSEADGFSVQGPKPTRKDVSLGAKGTMRSYVFAKDALSAIAVNVRDLPSADAAAVLAPKLPSLAVLGVKETGLELAKTEESTVAGERAGRARGFAKGDGAVRRAESIVVVHGARLYMIVAVQMGNGPDTLDDDVTKFLATFRFR